MAGAQGERSREWEDIGGYFHPGYAESLAEFGRPRALPCCGGYILERPIPGSDARDAMGCYPLFCCANWNALPEDLHQIRDLVSLVCVVDPFAPCDQAALATWFDVVLAFKPHFVTELREPLETIVSRSHQATVRRALRHVEVQRCAEPQQVLAEWVTLFDCLIERHRIRGLRAFSRAAFARQLTLPGTVLFRAVAGDGEPVGMELWYVRGDVAYAHLAAYSARGYQLRASYATKWGALRFFHGKVRWLELAGSAGISAGSEDGLTAFKRGWATGTRMAYLCGRIFDRPRYQALCDARRIDDTRYFPAYRQGEFQ